MEVVELGISGSKSNEISRVSKMLQILSSSLLKIEPNQTRLREILRLVLRTGRQVT